VHIYSSTSFRRVLPPSSPILSICLSIAPIAISTLSLHDALPICLPAGLVADPDRSGHRLRLFHPFSPHNGCRPFRLKSAHARQRSEEHTSELQSRENLVCRLLLEKKKYLHTACLASACLSISTNA